MNVDLCDICKNPIEGRKSLTGGMKLKYRVKIKSIEEGFSLMGYFKEVQNLEMCPQCMNSFVRFVEEKKKVE